MSRIAILPSAYLPTLGGVQELTRHLALALSDAGDAVEIWTQQADEVPGPTIERLDGLTIRRIPFPLPRAHPAAAISSTLAATSSLRALRRAVKEFKPDVLHVQCFGPNGAYATALSALTGLPLVLTLQGETVMDDHDAFTVSTTLRSALRMGLRRARVVTGCSQFTLDDAVTRFGLGPRQGRVIFNGVVVDAQPDPVDTSEIPEGQRYVLALGRVVPNKGFDLLLRAFALTAARQPDVDLFLGGAGPDEEALRSLAHELGLAERVRFLGRLSRTAVASSMERAEVFVMPSRLEPFGIVLLEAWRQGRPIIATSRGGPPEFVQEGQNGLLVDPFDAPALAQAMDRVLSDPALAAHLGDGGRRRVDDFDWRLVAAQYQDCYQAARQPRRRLPR